jgi:hypothetical protein
MLTGSRPVMPISDIRRGTMVAGQKLKELFAFSSMVAPGGKSAKTAAQKFHDPRGQRTRRGRLNIEKRRRCVSEIAIGHETRSKERHERNVVAWCRYRHPITDCRLSLFRPRTVLA